MKVRIITTNSNHTFRFGSKKEKEKEKNENVGKEGKRNSNRPV